MVFFMRGKMHVKAFFDEVTHGMKLERSKLFLTIIHVSERTIDQV
jgi:hypothetical protein